MKKCSPIAVLPILIMGLLSTGPINADCGSETTWSLSGVVSDCDAFACDLFGVSVGDPVTGFLSADAAVAGPNSTFGAADILDYQFVAGDISLPPANSTLDSATIITDGDGEISGGSLVLSGPVDIGLPYGLVDVAVTIDAAAGTFAISTNFLGIGLIASGVIDFARNPDTDGDGQPDTCDPDDDNDGILDCIDTEPLIFNNGCPDPTSDFVTDDASVEEQIAVDFTCVANVSVTVSGATQVFGTDGHLRTIGPVTRLLEGFKVFEGGSLTVITGNPSDPSICF